MELALSDPTYAPVENPHVIDRLTLRMIHDPRDLPFVRLMAFFTATIVPTGVAVFFVSGALRWGLAVVHLALVVYYIGPFILMLHNTSHRRLFKAPFGRLNLYIPWVLGPFFGETPETYFAHHVGMHHPENNLADDLSSTLPYRRDSILGFLHYFGRFMVIGLAELAAYFAKRRRKNLLVRMLVGELGFYLVVGALLALDWQAALAVFVIPVVITRFGMMAGNWGQHAFVDQAAPENSYRNSITCINSGYNRRCFNDGYHIGHHVKQTRHWTEMPGDFQRNMRTYADEGAIVFSGIDFFGVWACLMLKRYDWLARRVVHLDGERSVDETVAMLKSRTSWTRG